LCEAEKMLQGPSFTLSWPRGLPTSYYLGW
jgi:hypothetical protein